MRSIKYREYARKCLEMVESVEGEEAKAFLVSMAQSWHRLAQVAEGLEQANVVWAKEEGQSAAYPNDAGGTRVPTGRGN
jgi:hypothetical protein